MSNKVKLVIGTIISLVPTIAMAAGLSTIIGTAGEASTLVTGTLPKLLFGLAVVYFFWGLGSYAFGVDDKTKAAAKTTMIYGVIIIFVMASIGGLVGLLQQGTGAGGGGVTAPTVS